MDVEAGDWGEDESGVQISQSIPPLVKRVAGLWAPEEAALMRNVRKKNIKLHFVRKGCMQKKYFSAICHCCAPVICFTP